MNKFIIVAILVVASGCSSLPRSDRAMLQGSWQGTEIGGKRESRCIISVAGSNAEFRGADQNEFLKATFSLREDTTPRQIIFVTTECNYPPEIGSTRYAIYQFEGETIRITASEPGDSRIPSRFDAPGARQFVLRRR